jgi:uncharacterized coiled-coil protein SlyX
MSDERFANLETIISFHEDTLQKLGDVVYKQQLKIDRLEELVDTLTRLVRGSGDLLSAEGGPKPE